LINFKQPSYIHKSEKDIVAKKPSGVSLASRLGDVNFAPFNAIGTDFQSCSFRTLPSQSRRPSDTSMLFLLDGLQFVGLQGDPFHNAMAAMILLYI
jgi:hypothetical protein